jgi:hypothetical protein
VIVVSLEDALGDSSLQSIVDVKIGRALALMKVVGPVDVLLDDNP